MPSGPCFDPHHMYSSPPLVFVFFLLIVKSTLFPVASHSTLPHWPDFHLRQLDTSLTDYTMPQSTIPHGSMSSALATCYKPSVNSIPIFEDECRKRHLPDLPSLDAIISLVGRTLTLDRGSQDPLKMTQGSEEEKDYRDPIEHHWQHCGTRIANLGGWETEVDLFAVDLATRKSESHETERAGTTLRAIMSQRKRRVDGQSGPTPRATFSVDDFPPFYETIMNNEIDSVSPVEPNEPNAYIVSVPHSMFTAMKTKIEEGGDARLHPILAQTMVHGVDKMLKLHFEGPGEVSIPDQWPAPETGMSAYHPSTEPGSRRLTAAEAVEQAEMDQLAHDIQSKFAPKPLSPEEKARSTQIGSEFAAWISQQSKKRAKKEKRGNKKKAQTDAGPSAMSDNA
jgi:hypothetical protein